MKTFLFLNQLRSPQTPTTTGRTFCVCAEKKRHEETDRERETERQRRTESRPVSPLLSTHSVPTQRVFSARANLGGRGLEARRGVQPPLGQAARHGGGEALDDVPGAGPHHVETHHALLAIKTTGTRRGLTGGEQTLNQSTLS